MPRNHDFSDLKVLLVDDNHFMVQLLTQMMHALGVHHIATANDGESAFDVFEDYAPGLIVSDWDMKPVNGEQLVRMLRDRDLSPDPYVPIVMLTGYSEIRRVMAARDFGVTEFLVKPISAKRLYQRLINIVERPRLFVDAEQYFGPCRRRDAANDFMGAERRTA